MDICPRLRYEAVETVFVEMASVRKPLATDLMT
jgi:hypothetical protein